MTNTKAQRTLGLVAGLGVGASVFYYRSIVEAHLALGLSAQLLMVHADVRRVMALAAARQADALADYLAGLLWQLKKGGADLACIPAFSPQVCADELAALTPLPLVGLLDVIGSEIAERRLQRVALFGARVTMETRLFGRLTGVDVISPQPAELDAIADLYGRVVEAARVSPEDFAWLRSLAHRLIERERLDAIVFAGTDLAFVFNPDNADFPHVDGARLHLAAIMRALTAA